MTAGWQGRWMRSGLVGLLGLALMATPAIAARPKSLGELLSRAQAEKDPKRRDALLLEGYLEAFTLDASECLAGSASACEDAIARRLMVHWTEHELAAHSKPLSPARPGTVLACSAGEALDGCLERALGPGMYGAVEDPRAARYAVIYLLQQPPRSVRFVIGEVSTAKGVEGMGQAAYRIELLADDSREEPLLLDVLRTSGVRTVSFGLSQVLEAERYVQHLGGAKTFVTNRPLDKGFFAICGNEVRKLEKPRLLRVTVGLGEFERVLFPEYHYALPCKASFTLDGSIPGIRAGRYGPGTLCPVRKKGPAGAPPPGEEVVPFAIQEDPATGQCHMDSSNLGQGSSLGFSGDLNGDGRRDFVLLLFGNMGCGGPTLYLSSPQGWFRAGFSERYC